MREKRHKVVSPTSQDKLFRFMLIFHYSFLKVRTKRHTVVMRYKTQCYFEHRSHNTCTISITFCFCAITFKSFFSQFYFVTRDASHGHSRVVKWGATALRPSIQALTTWKEFSPRKRRCLSLCAFLDEQIYMQC